MLFRNSRFFSNFVAPQASWKKPVRVAITGGSGNIGYALAFRIAAGEMLGPSQPIILHILDIPAGEQKLSGVKMELDDCAFPLLQETKTFTNESDGFKDVDYALLVGSLPRGKGMERKDLLALNGKIFVNTGKAINDNASRNIKTLVVGNPANTNCLIASHHAKDLPKKNFHAMTRLDHDRGLFQVANKFGVSHLDIENFCIWGNHSSTMYPDLSYLKIKGNKVDNIDKEWCKKTFIPTVQQRGASIINARGLSSAQSAGNAAISHMRDWVYGTNGKWTSMAILSDGKDYGVSEGVMFSYPVTTDGKSVNIVKGLDLNEDSKQGIAKTLKELMEERDAVSNLLN